MKTVQEVSALSGVSVRTLHYYDEIGLLPPTTLSEAGYRLYDDAALERLQQILFFRELDFSLKEIRRVMKEERTDRQKTLRNHKKLLLLKRERLDGLIRLLEDTMKGENTMQFEEFDMSAIEQAKQEYAEEVKERWGNTQAYHESAKKTAQYGKREWAEISANNDRIYTGFAHLAKEGADPAEQPAQQLVADWQGSITKYFYHCSDEILAGLGEMYVADERFTKNIDQYGTGTAQFISDAIRHYCKKV